MAMHKHLISSGMTVLMQGYRNFDVWSVRMVNDFGPSIRPILQDVFHWSLLIMETKSRPFRRRINCWEFKHCHMDKGHMNGGRGRSCPAVLETRLNRVHHGINGGRSCWALNGTLCYGKKQRHYHKKQKMCRSCDFYCMVIEEEGIDVILPVEFLRSCVLDI